MASNKSLGRKHLFQAVFCPISVLLYQICHYFSLKIQVLTKSLDRGNNICAVVVSSSFLPHVCAALLNLVLFSIYRYKYQVTKEKERKQYLCHFCFKQFFAPYLCCFIKFVTIFSLKIRVPTKSQERGNNTCVAFVSKNLMPHPGFDDMSFSILERSRLPATFVGKSLRQNME